MSDGGIFDAGVLSNVARAAPAQAISDAGRQVVTPDPIGGTSVLDTVAVITSPATLPGQVTPAEFSVMLGSAILDQLPNIPERGTDQRDLLDNAVGVACTAVLKAISGNLDASINSAIERWLGPIDRRTGDTATSVVKDLVAKVDFSDYVKFLADIDRARASNLTAAGSEQDEQAEEAAVAQALDEATDAEARRVVSGERETVRPEVPPGISTIISNSPQYSAMLAAAQQIALAMPPGTGAISSNLLIGQLVHIAIQTHYRVNRPSSLLMMERYVWCQKALLGTIGSLKTSTGNTVIDLLSRAFETLSKNHYVSNLKPDILDIPRHEIYEIKPRSRAAIAVEELVLYKTWYDKENPPTPLNFGTSYPPPSIIPISYNIIARAYIDQSVPGLIYYDVYLLDIKVPLPKLAANENEETKNASDQTVSSEIATALMVAALIGLAFIFAPEIAILAGAAFTGSFSALLNPLSRVAATAGSEIVLSP